MKSLDILPLADEAETTKLPSPEDARVAANVTWGVRDVNAMKDSAEAARTWQQASAADLELRRRRVADAHCCRAVVLSPQGAEILCLRHQRPAVVVEEKWKYEYRVNKLIVFMADFDIFW